MEQIINEIQNKIEFLKNKFNYDKECKLNNIPISSENIWTNADAILLHNLIEVCKYLHVLSYNSVLQQITSDDNSIIDTYCNEKKDAIQKEIPKHRSKYILRELQDELDELERILENKENFVKSKMRYIVSVDKLLNTNTVGSTAVASQLKSVYFNESLNPSYKIVLEELLDGNFENYNKLGNITSIKSEMRELSRVFDRNMMWEINNKIDSFLHNDFNSVNEKDLFKEVSTYMANFIKYSAYLSEMGINLPDANGNYFINVQNFMKQVIENNFLGNIMNSLRTEIEVLQGSLPKEYNDIEYGFFGTVSGKPGVAYFYHDERRFEEAKNIKYICELISRAKALEGVNLSDEIIGKVNQDMVEKIDSEVGFKIR